MARVVIHQDETGWPVVYADGEVEVFWVDEGAPDDRTYKMSPEPVPDGILDAEHGYMDDGTAASIKAERAKRELAGERHLSIVSPEAE